MQVELTEEDAEMFKTFLKLHDLWEEFFAEEFVGSVTLHKSGKELVAEWKTKDKYCV